MTVRPQKQDDPQPGKQKETDRQEVEDELDEGLDETFPASDPVAIVDPSLPRSPANKHDHERESDSDEKTKSGRRPGS